MEIIKGVFGSLNELGASVTMPIIMTIIGLIVGMKFTQALRSGILYGIGFEGLWLVLGYFMDTLAGATNAMSANLGLNLDVIDAGWVLGASMAFSSSLLPLSIIGIILANIILIRVGFLKTLNIDLWNYWMLIAGGVLIYTATGSYWLGFTVVILSSIIIAKLADMFAKKSWDAGVVPEGITLPHLDTISMAPIYYGVNKLIDVIPGVNKWDISLEKIEDKIGIFGEPAFMGIILGGLLGVFAGFNVPEILNLAIVSGATMVLMPRVCAILMEGLAPIAEATKEIVSKKMKDKEVYIGMDVAIGVGNPTVLIVSIIIIPIMLVLSAIIPGNRMLPFADLSSMALYVLWAVVVCKGNLFRSIVAAIVGAIVYLLCGTFVSNVYTQAAINAAPDLIPEGTMFVSSISAGNPLYTILLFITKLFSK